MSASWFLASKFCSTKCAADSRVSDEIKHCCSCGALIENKRNGNFSGRKYCSESCVPRRKPDGELSSATRYVYTRVGGKKVAEHRLVIERILGRKLLATEHVHHVNGNKRDNRPENLEVLEASDHLRIHGYGNRNALRHGQYSIRMEGGLIE